MDPIMVAIDLLYHWQQITSLSWRRHGCYGSVVPLPWSCPVAALVAMVAMDLSYRCYGPVISFLRTCHIVSMDLSYRCYGPVVFVKQEARVVCGRFLVDTRTAVQSQKAVSAHFTSKQISPFGFAEQVSPACIINHSDWQTLTPCSCDLGLKYLQWTEVKWKSCL